MDDKLLNNAEANKSSTQLTKKELVQQSFEQNGLTFGQVMIQLAYCAEEFFVTETSEVYATIPIRNIHENLAVKSAMFKKWLRAEFFELIGKAPSSGLLTDAIDMVAAREELTSENIKNVAIRIAEKSGKLYIDLANSKRQVVEIDTSGWRVIENNRCPIKFIRPSKLLEMPMPVRNGSIDELKRFVNVEGHDWVLFVSFILTVLRSKGPFPILVFQGISGNGKSTHSRVIKRLVDPQTVEIASLSRNEDDLLIFSKETILPVFDNVSNISNEASDSLCKLSTGAAISTRSYYTNGEEFIMSSMRPAIVNGIDYIAHRSDFASRSIIINLPVLGGRRKDEKTFWEQFDEAKPRIFGAFIDVLCKSITDLPTIKIDNLPRLADFALLSVAAEKHFGFEEGAFMRAFESNHSVAAKDALEGSLIGLAIEKCLMTREIIEGTADEVLTLLKTFVSQEDFKDKNWVKANHFKNLMDRMQPTLLKNGMTYEYVRKSHGRIHTISKIQ
ncbi:hypothetical protein PGH26_02015 [Sporosarcina jeotgali]|uniref:SF3 helicase domain-containing protein n=1 Tax=Sporosarcina jeotgali TaxID=3020056 RepID=A0ABZ0L0M0_9BACL|nr:hypothetical protein [Sporosarcina sp. B2O-1]WOV84724.1 hypothetical protein PGH26_02015 [Sporosarcina sp. B2O-1]